MHTSMIPLLFSTIDILTGSLSGVNAGAVNTTGSSQRCGEINNCRTLDGIVQSCLVTILACVWFAVHRNIPAPQPIQSRHPNFFVRGAKWVWRTVLDWMQAAMVFVVALLAPEWILAWALRQAMVAWKLARTLECARLKASAEAPIYSTCDPRERRGCQCDRAASAKRVAKGEECWEWSHGFLVAMGGFHFYNTGVPLYPLSPANAAELVRRGHLVPPTPAEMSDKSKGDTVSKGIAVAQTLWFVIQCIARHTEQLPVTTLEVMTLAYTVMTVAMYITWWAKPLNVSCAVCVPEEEVQKERVQKYDSIWERIVIYVMGGQDDYVDLRQRKRVPTFWAGKVDGSGAYIADIIALLVAMAFGAVHCLAWYSEFQSPLEQLLWRWSAITIIAVPAVLAVLFWVAIVVAKYRDMDDNGAVSLVGAMYTPVSIVYIAARLILIILSFTSLRGLPFTAYQTVRWTTFIPHI